MEQYGFLLYEGIWEYNVGKMKMSEYKFFKFIINCVNFYKRNFEIISFSSKKYATILGIDEKYCKFLLKKICNSFQNGINLQLKQNGLIYDKGKMNFFEKIIYEDNKVICKIDSKFEKFFLEPWLNIDTPLKEILFPTFDLEKVGTHFLYQTLRMNRENMLFKIDELRKYMLENDTYSKYSHFKEKILIPGIEEINKKTDIYLEFEEQKEEKKVVGIFFKFYWNDKVQSYDNISMNFIKSILFENTN